MATLAATSDAFAASAKPLRILILGGTGFIGPHQVRYALKRGHKVTLFNRGHEPDAWGGQVEELIGDRNTGDLKALEGREWDVCIDNPTTLPSGSATPARRWPARSGSTSSSPPFRSTPQRRAGRRERGGAALHRRRPHGRDPGHPLTASNRGLYGPLKAVSEAERSASSVRRLTVIPPGPDRRPGRRDRPLHLLAGPAGDGAATVPGARRRHGPGSSSSTPATWPNGPSAWPSNAALASSTRRGPAHELNMGALLADIEATVRPDAQLVWVPEDLSRRQQRLGLVRPAGLGSRPGRHRRLCPARHPQGARGRPHLPSAANDHDRHPGLVQDPADARQAKLRAGLAPDREADLLAEWAASAANG
ncbi:MAG: NAD-dependent epimerase/dehydratase family protein [Caulobacteraceae bacterium]